MIYGQSRLIYRLNMYMHDLIIFIGAFISEMLGTLSGFGSSTFFVPLASFFENFQLVLALTAILHCFGNLSKFFLFRKNLNFDSVVKFALPSIVLTALGAYLTTHISTMFLEKALGVFLVLFGAYKLFLKNRLLSLSNTKAVALIGLSGFLTGFVGTGGAVRGVVLSALHLPKESFVVLSSSIDFGGDVVRAGIYLTNGYMDWTQWFYIPLLLLAGFLGSYVGKKILTRINQDQFEIIVSIFLIIAGITMLTGKQT